MRNVALKILTGDTAKYLGLIFGIMFATLLMSQQVSIFMGLLGRTASQITDVTEADIWVMDPMVDYIDQIKSLPDRDLMRVRSVNGVKWAVPFFKGMGMAQTVDGTMQNVIILGVDDSTLIGQPPQMLYGKWEDLKEPNSIIIDQDGFKYLWPNEALSIGKTLEINERRITIVGICAASPPFVTNPVVYTRYSIAKQLAKSEGNQMSFILVKAQEEINDLTLAKEIENRTHLQALTKKDFQHRSIQYYMEHTGIPINFGITVLLGFIIGAAITGQTFYLFIIENIKQFGALKAIGVTNGQILRMVLLQASVVASIGFSLGIGLCALFFELTSNVPALRGFTLDWQVVLGTAFAVLVIVFLASIFSIRRVFTIDPAIVFRG
ncbi:ABC transporter permease [Candidatus Berkiella aquae]|uniref:ABC transporter permease n=1 Tax=Candidatus Berkiella aquae TaxID=295108 RepID=A0A0Q9YII1_9GAMM|nr:ABC transporter permease [Candidatus Berkiella aquae]MCS5712222.1 ABC transporter permease [Candidatus Berkiella aquae]